MTQDRDIASTPNDPKRTELERRDFIANNVKRIIFSAAVFGTLAPSALASYLEPGDGGHHIDTYVDTCEHSDWGHIDSVTNILNIWCNHSDSPHGNSTECGEGQHANHVNHVDNSHTNAAFPIRSRYHVDA